MGTFFGNKKGMGLLEVLVAGGAAAIIAVATSQMTTNMFKTQKSAAITADLNSLFGEMTLIFNDSANCSRTFGQAPGPQIALNSTTRNLPFTNSAGTTLYATNGTASYINGTIRITGWRFEQIRVLNATPTYTVEGRLTIDFEKNEMAQAKTVGGSKISRNMMMSATLTGAGGTVITCASTQNSMNPSYWTLLGNDIYNTNSANVGVGTSTPTHKFSVVETVDGTKIQAVNPSNNFAVNLGTDGTSAYVSSANTNLDLMAGGVTGLRVESGTGNLLATRNIFMPTLAIRGDNGSNSDRTYFRGATNHFVLAPASNRTGGADANVMYLAYPGDLAAGVDVVNTILQNTLYIGNTTNAGGGDVGIGGAAVSGVKLNVNGGAITPLRIDTTGTDILMSTAKNHVMYFGTAVQNNDGLLFWNNTYGSVMRIASNGRVGVNNNAPTQALDVTGSINATGSLTAATLAGSSFCIGGQCRTTFATQTCPAGSNLTTINADGTISCTDSGISMFNAGLSCPVGSFLAGTNPGTGAPVCRAVPTPFCPVGSYLVSYNSATDTANCAIVPPEVQVFDCPAEQFLTGISGGVGTCSYPVANKTCAAGEMVIEINNGTVICGNENQTNDACALGEKVQGFDATGSALCVAETENSTSGTAGQAITSFSATGAPNYTTMAAVSTACLTNEKIVGFNASGAAICAAEVQNGQTCPAGQKISGFDGNGNRVCANETQNSQTCPTGYVSGFTNAGVRTCFTPSGSTPTPYTKVSVAITSGNPSASTSVSCPATYLVRSCGITAGGAIGGPDMAFCRLNVAGNSCIGMRDVEDTAEAMTLECFCEAP